MMTTTSAPPTRLPMTLASQALALTQQAAAAQWRGPDPYDGLWWHWPTAIVAGRRRRQLMTQVHVRSPVDIRILYRRTHPLVPKALALFGSASLRINALTGGPGAKDLATSALGVLADDRTAGDHVWGYHFDVQTRWSFDPAGTPCLVNTAFAVAALLEAERMIGRRDLGDRARRAARWVLEHLWLEREGCFAYHPGSRVRIHNASILGAWAVWTALGEEAREPVGCVLERTISAQRADGSWPYGTGGGNLDWADSFHTGYVLGCLARMHHVDPRVDDAVARGAKHFEDFFGSSGQPQLWTHRRYPEDGHSAGTGLTTLALLQRRGLIDPALLHRVARRVLTAGIRSDHAVFRRYRFGLPTFVHYIRWCDAHVALGLADAALAMEGREDPAERDPRATASQA
jgi:hypothetical protein